MGRQVEMKMFVKPISPLKYEQKGLGPLPCMLEWRSSSNFIPHATENNHLPIWLSVGIPFWGFLVTSWERHLKVWGAVGHQRNMLDLYNHLIALDRSANDISKEKVECVICTGKKDTTTSPLCWTTNTNKMVSAHKLIPILVLTCRWILTTSIPPGSGWAHHDN